MATRGAGRGQAPVGSPRRGDGRARRVGDGDPLSGAALGPAHARLVPIRTSGRHTARGTAKFARSRGGARDRSGRVAPGSRRAILLQDPEVDWVPPASSGAAVITTEGRAEGRRDVGGRRSRWRSLKTISSSVHSEMAWLDDLLARRGRTRGSGGARRARLGTDDAGGEFGPGAFTSRVARSCTAQVDEPALEAAASARCGGHRRLARRPLRRRPRAVRSGAARIVGKLAQSTASRWCSSSTTSIGPARRPSRCSSS